MLEKQIEKAGASYARTKNHAAYKFTSPQHTGVPDRLMLAPIPPQHRELIARYIRFAEYKQKGKKPTARQQLEHARLRELGFRVELIDSVESALRAVDEMG